LQDADPAAEVQTPPAGDPVDEEAEEVPEVEIWRLAIIVGLVMLSGCFSGLNLGVLGLETKNLEMMTQGPWEDK